MARDIPNGPDVSSEHHKDAPEVIRPNTSQRDIDEAFEEFVGHGTLFPQYEGIFMKDLLRAAGLLNRDVDSERIERDMWMVVDEVDSNYDMDLGKSVIDFAELEIRITDAQVDAEKGIIRLSCEAAVVREGKSSDPDAAKRHTFEQAENKKKLVGEWQASDDIKEQMERQLEGDKRLKEQLREAESYLAVWLPDNLGEHIVLADLDKKTRDAIRDFFMVVEEGLTISFTRDPGGILCAIWDGRSLVDVKVIESEIIEKALDKK